MFTDISLSSYELLTATALGVIFLFALVFLSRLYLSKKSKALVESHKNEPHASGPGRQSKYPEVDVLRNSNTFLRLGLVLSIGLMIGAFSLTSTDAVVDIPDNALELDVDLEIEPPRSKAEPPPPPPPPPPTIEEVPDELILEEEEVEFVDQSVDANTEIEAPEPVVAKKDAAPAPPPPPPPPPEEEYEEIFKVVEEMPRFPGCETMAGTVAEKKACADQKMLEFLYEHLSYPSIARENGIVGTVVIQFVVARDGKIKDARIAREIGAGCGDEALRVVNMMNSKNITWIPGKQRGREVQVMFSLPVRFVLKNT